MNLFYNIFYLLVCQCYCWTCSRWRFFIKLICFLFPNYFSAVCANLTSPSFAAFITAINAASSKPAAKPPRNPLDYFILKICVFKNLMLVNKLLSKSFRSLENLFYHSRKFVLSLELSFTFDDNLKVTSVEFFAADFNLLSWEFDDFAFKFYIKTFYTSIILNQNKFVIGTLCKKILLCFLYDLHLQKNWFFVFLLDQHQELIVYLRLL